MNAEGNFTAYAVIATKGRPESLEPLSELLLAQTVRFGKIVFVGTSEQDFPSGYQGKVAKSAVFEYLISPKAGLTSQRNFGIEYLRALDGELFDNSVCVFFDDDFRPDSRWLENALRIFSESAHIAGVTGRVLADGIHHPTGISEAAAIKYLSGIIEPDTQHFTSHEGQRPISALYGCNMAIRSKYFRSCKFDENLPAYGWQEDRDITGQLANFGTCVLDSSCRGVHLGSKKGRVSGVKFGYSQVANLTYMRSKGTITFPVCAQFIGRNFCANIIKSIFGFKYKHVDYRGRLLGNFMAFRDLLVHRLSPTNIVLLK